MIEIPTHCTSSDERPVEIGGGKLPPLGDVSCCLCSSGQPIKVHGPKGPRQPRSGWNEERSGISGFTPSICDPGSTTHCCHLERYLEYNEDEWCKVLVTLRLYCSRACFCLELGKGPYQMHLRFLNWPGLGQRDKGNFAPWKVHWSL